MGNVHYMRRSSDLAGENARLRAELKNARHQVEALLKEACTDELTGLFNRRGFQRLGEEVLQRAFHARQAVSLVYVDVDGLKALNDSQGHDAGDQLLVETATLLRSAFRELDVVARLGGDEFAVLIQGRLGDDEPIEDRLERVGQLLHDTGLLKHRISLSAGVVTTVPDGYPELNAMLLRADDAMYAAKRAKRQRAGAGLSGNAPKRHLRPASLSRRPEFPTPLHAAHLHGCQVVPPLEV